MVRRKVSLLVNEEKDWKFSVTSHGDIYTIPWREEHKSMSIQSQNRNGPAGVGKYRRDTAEESASVLEDLDHLLDNEELTLQQRMSRLELQLGPEKVWRCVKKLGEVRIWQELALSVVW
ncbi:hypothetical protein COOONC_04028 [Cooperia oncophora]